MFKKNHEVIIRSAWSMDLVKVLGKYGIKFEVSREYLGPTGVAGKEAWLRNFTIRASERKYKKLMEEFYKNIKANK